jgi:hypothetical protein
MAPNRIMRGRVVRRALLAGAVLGLLAAAFSACASGGGSSSTAEKEHDVKVLNDLLGRQLAAVEAYERVLPRLHGSDRAEAEQFRAQEQEHADATTKLLRRIDGEAVPTEEAIETDDLTTRAENLELLYEMESATTDFELGVVGKLTIDWPRPLISSMAANQAQRLVLLRRALGASPSETIPSAFETGETPAPERTAVK